MIPSTSSLPLFLRLRTRTGIRPLVIDEPVGALLLSGEALHDKITAKATARIYLPESDVEALLSSSDNRDGAGGSGLVLCDAGIGWPFKLRTLSKEWLFGMSGRARYNDAAGRLDVELDLELNPTRFVAHQANPSLETIRSLPPLDALRRDPAVSERLRAQTLDGNDNCIIGVERFPPYPTFANRDAWWEAVLRAYLGHVSSALSEALTPREGRLDRFDITSITTAEVYWELAHSAALEFAAGLASWVTTADAAASVRTYPPAIEGQGNAQVLRLKTRAGIDLKIYAKMFGRVRFEIEYREKGRLKDVATGRGRYTKKDVVDILQGLRGDAMKRAHSFWTGAMRLRELHEEAMSIKQLIQAVNAHSDEPEAVLRALFTNRRLEQTGPSGFAPKATCEALEREGICVRPRIRKRAASPQFTLSSGYRRLLDDLDSMNSRGTSPH